MKNTLSTIVYFLAASTMLLLSNCGKHIDDLKPSPNVDSAIVNVLYPATQSSYQGGQSAYPSVVKYEYDKNNHMTRYTRDSTFIVNIGSNQVDKITQQYNANSNGKSSLSSVSTLSYVYSLVGTTNTPVNFYNTAPTQVTITLYNKDLSTGILQSTVGGQWQFENNKDGLPLREITSDGGGRNYDFTYDSKGNLKMVEFVKLSGSRAGAVYERLTVTSLDNKHSPFSSIKGYWPISYSQAYPWDFAWAFCKNNPVQTKDEIYDDTTNSYVPYEQDDYAYTYNDKGFPTQIIINTTYYTAVTTHYIETYNYTYK